MRDKFEVTPYWLCCTRLVVMFATVFMGMKFLESRGISPFLFGVIFSMIAVIYNFAVTIGPAGIIKATDKGFLYIDEDTFRKYVYEDLLQDIPEGYLAFKYRIMKSLMKIYACSTEEEFKNVINLLKYRKVAVKNEVICKISDDISRVNAMINTYESIDNANDEETKYIRFAYMTMMTSLEKIVDYFKEKLPTRFGKIVDDKFYTPVGTFDYADTSLTRVIKGCDAFTDGLNCMSNDSIFAAELSKLNCMKSLLESELVIFKNDETATDSKYYLRYVTELQKWVEDEVDPSAPAVWRDFD